MADTNIEWADKNLNFYTWNCHKVSPGCAHCYAADLAARYGKVFAGAPEWRDTAIKDWRSLKAGDSTFVNTMSDSFHEQAPVKYIHWMFQYAAWRPDVTFLFLTKRIERALYLAPHLDWQPNIWLGTSVENADYAWRIDYLRKTPAKHKFISFEPLLASVGDVDLRGIDGVIVGAESGGKRRPFDLDWAREIRALCKRDGVAFFYKQGTAFKPGQNRLLDGREYNELAWHSNKIVHTEAQTPMLQLIEPVRQFSFLED